jgi:DNA repair protein RadC
VKHSTATLLKLVDRIRSEGSSEAKTSQPELAERRSATYPMLQPFLFGVDEPQPEVSPVRPTPDAPPGKREVTGRPRSGLFSKAVLQEAIQLVPQLPDSESLDEVTDFLRANLHYSGEATRHRHANYIVRRMFPSGHADGALRAFARRYAGRQELRDVCFYRFSMAEPLMLDISEDVLMPALSSGVLSRSRLKDYLNERFPGYKSVPDCYNAVAAAWEAAGFVKVERQFFSFSYRQPSVAAFAFVLHSEFPEPGMYDVAKLESNRAIKALLWNPDSILPALYELRNLGLLSKVSQIDAFRQFTTKGELTQAVNMLLSVEVGS